MLFGRWATLIGNGLNGTEGDTDTEMEEGDGQRRDDGGKKARADQSASLGKLSQLLPPLI